MAKTVETQFGPIYYDLDFNAPDPNVPNQEEAHMESTVKVICFYLKGIFGEEKTKKIVKQHNSFSKLQDFKDQLHKDISLIAAEKNISMKEAAKQIDLKARLHQLT